MKITEFLKPTTGKVLITLVFIIAAVSSTMRPDCFVRDLPKPQYCYSNFFLIATMLSLPFFLPPEFLNTYLNISAPSILYLIGILASYLLASIICIFINKNTLKYLRNITKGIN